MALLDLVNDLLGDILKGNIYTNTDPYKQTILQRPEVPIGSTDPRLLNFKEQNMHPHPGVAGDNPTKHVVHSPPMHDNYGDFVNQPSGKVPGGKRGELYQPGGIVPQSVHTQKDNLQKDVTPPPGPTAPGTAKGAGENYTIRRMDRNEIYGQSDSLNRKGSALSDLMDFHESRTHPHEDGRIIPNAPPMRNAESPGYVNKSGKHPAEHGPPPMSRDEVYSTSDHLNRKDRQVANLNAEGNNKFVGELNDNFQSTPHPHHDPIDQTKTSKVIPTPEAPATDSPAFHRPDGLSPSQHGTNSSVPPTPENYDRGETELRTWDNMAGVKRDNIYKNPNNSNQNIPPDPISQKSIVQDSQSFEKGKAFESTTREEIYKFEGDSRKRQAAAGIDNSEFSRTTLGDARSLKGKPPAPPLHEDIIIDDKLTGLPKESQAFRDDRTISVSEDYRKDIYKNRQSSLDDTDSAIHKTIKPHTLGDAKSVLQQPPTLPLSSDDIENGFKRSEFAPPQGRLQDHPATYRGGNEYWDSGADLIRGGNYTLFPGEVGAPRHLDPVAAAHWLRGVLRECYFVPSTQNDPITGQTRTGVTDETIAKSAIWVASQFLLTAMNPTDTFGYGELNAIWNPLSIGLSAIPLVRSSAATNITAGAALEGLIDGGGLYTTNVLASVAAEQAASAGAALVGDTLGAAIGAAGGERLLQMRRGSYVKSVDGTMVAQLQTPDAGFEGDIASANIGGTETIEGKNVLGSLLSTADPKVMSIQEQVETDAAAKAGIHGNLYSENNKYLDNPIQPQSKLEEELVAKDLRTINEAQNISLAQRFKAQSKPGGSVFGLAGDKTSNAYSWMATQRSERDVGFDNKDLFDAPGVSTSKRDSSIINADFLLEENDGTHKKLLKDEDVYMPLMFQDLRESPPKFVYFRAFLKPGVVETFTPEYQTDRFYGRTDPVPVYQGTLRTFNFGFDVVAWSPADFPVIWKKLEKLQSMVYPAFNSAGFMNAGPIIRVRIGDLFAGKDRRGLPGYMTTMDWAYDDGIWNITPEKKAPRKIAVSIGFTVLHDGNPGLYPFQAGETEHALTTDTAPSNTEAGKLQSFGVGKFSYTKDGTNIKISRAEMRKIFQSVKPTTKNT